MFFGRSLTYAAHFTNSQVPLPLINGQDWDAFKYHIVSPVIHTLNSDTEGLGPLRRIVKETLAYKNGDHLLWLGDGKKRKAEAERCLNHLRQLQESQAAEKEKAEAERVERVRQHQTNRGSLEFDQKLADLMERFLRYHSDTDTQERGFRLEDILYDLFLLFDLSPKASFRRVGEQIDGAFVLDGQHFLLEAKWVKNPVDLAALRDLDGSVKRGLDNTLGLFISINGFSEQALAAYGDGERKKLICMDGTDLMASLVGQVPLPDLLRRKKDVAVQRGRVYVTVAEIFSGTV